MRLWKTFVMAGVATLLCSATAPAYFDDYDDSQSHPLRIAAYALYPVGYTVEWLVTRPIHALVSQPELEPIFGHRPHRWGGEEGMPLATGPTTAPPAAVAGGPTVNPADLEAARRAADEARASAEEAKRAAEEAARAAEKATRAFDKGLHK